MSDITLNSLKHDMMERFQALGLHVDCLSDGDVKSEIAIVAQAPGERESIAKSPLIGGSGQLLWNVLRPHGIRRVDCYITNVVKRRLIVQKRKANIGAAELDAWQTILRWELSKLPNLRYVVVLGDYALQAITGEKGITQWRGSVVDTDIVAVAGSGVRENETVRRSVKAICTYNPAMVLHEPKTEIVFRMDCAKLKKVIDGTYKPHRIEHHINPSPAEAIDWCNRMQDERLPVSLDIEVISGETACVGLANNAHEGMCINFRGASNNRWAVPDERTVRERIARLVADPATKVVAQNGSFDCSWLWYKDRIRVHRVWFDTMLAHHSLYSQLPHGLGFLTAQYTTHPYYKDDKSAWREGGDIDTFWRYNVKDACITRAVQQREEAELRQQGLEDFFFNHVMRLQPHLVRMTVGGVKVDMAMKNKLTEQLSQHVLDLKEDFMRKMRVATGGTIHEVNPNSPQQLAALFFKHLRLIGRGTSTASENRTRMRNHPGTSDRAKQVLDALDVYKTEQKFFSTYAEMTADPDGRIRTEYKQMGTQKAPGRLSSAAPLWGTGGNLQNIPERAHGMFVADKGYALCYFDLEQAEARVVGRLARIDRWNEQFERARLDGSYDCHRALASDMWRIPYDDVPTFDRDSDGLPTKRFVAKRCRHGLNYRMGPDRLATVTGLPPGEALAAYEIYHHTTPELRQWWAETEQEIRKNRFLISPMGRCLRILERITDEAMESIVAFRPQSCIGDKVSQVMYEAEDDSRWPSDARMLLNIHDALIAIAPLAKVEHVLGIMKAYAEKPIYIHGEPLIIPASCKVSQPDERGVHRWDSLSGVQIEAARIAA